MLTVRPALRREVADVASRLRPEDRREVETASGQAPEALLLSMFYTTDHIYTIRGSADEAPFALFGLTPSEGGVAAVWLLATPEVTRYARALAREAKPWLEGWATAYRLVNMVDARNTLHVRWCRLMGFTSGEPVMHNGHPFIPIEYSPDV